jgi:5-methylcytosine-specific restriction enzyme subunit McrC
MNAGIVNVTLDEADRRGCFLEMSAPSAAALARTQLVEVRPAAEGRWQLLPCGHVGAVRVGDLQVQVTPKEKVGLSRLLFLLGYAQDPGFTPESVTAAGEPGLWPVIAESLARLVRSAFAGGVLHSYRTTDEALRTVRGRIRLSDQIARRPGFMTPLEVTYDDFTADITENRIIRSALRRVLAVPRLADRTRGELARLDRLLDGVGVFRQEPALPRWRPTRLNKRYQPALRLAELILRNTSAEPAVGGLRVAAFVVSMWKVFEDFVGTALAESLRRYPGRTQSTPQYVSWLDHPQPGHYRGAVRLSLDVVHLIQGVPRLIFDAKYKVENSQGQYPNADHYQMLAYCTALAVSKAWLVYAQGGQPPTTRVIKNTGISIIEYPLDLRREPSDLLAQIDRLADHAWATIEDPHAPPGKALP